MPRRNRVTPFGDIIATEARGLLFGNRGVLHDDNGRLVRAWQVRRWIACRLEFKGRRRELMRPGRFTELFFLDEATALAAGHRPCAECRREDFLRFRQAWTDIHPGGPPRADDMDRALHGERIDTDGRKRLHKSKLSDLPDGSMIGEEDRAWIVFGGDLLPWFLVRVRREAGHARIDDGSDPHAAVCDRCDSGRLRTGAPPDYPRSPDRSVATPGSGMGGSRVGSSKGICVHAEEVVGMRKLPLWGAVIVIALVAVAGGAALASGSGRGDQFRANMNGYENAPSISTVARGTFRAEIIGEVIRYRLSYQDLETPALFAHIHFSERGVNGGVVAFLCGGGDKPACPMTSGTVTGTIDPADVLALDDQGIEAGSFAELVRAMRAGATYANVHSERFPSGEIRGQIQEGVHH